MLKLGILFKKRQRNTQDNFINNRPYCIKTCFLDLFQKEFKIERLSQVRDIFLFSCYTGLSYIDVKQLTRNNISMGIDGERWIFTNRQKTDGRSNYFQFVLKKLNVHLLLR